MVLSGFEGLIANYIPFELQDVIPPFNNRVY